MRSRPPTIRARMRALLGTLAALLTVVLTACADPQTARDEGPAPALPAATSSNAKAQKPQHSYTTTHLRTALLKTHSAPVAENVELVRNAVRGCGGCLRNRTVIEVGGTVFQQAAVSSHTGKQPFALVLFSTSASKPTVRLVVTGSDVTATPGANNTLVVQESVHRTGDRACCASAWAVTVYRLTDGSFDAGQRILHTRAPTTRSTSSR